jgi:hypothetical protein
LKGVKRTINEPIGAEAAGHGGHIEGERCKTGADGDQRRNPVRTAFLVWMSQRPLKTVGRFL